MSLGRLTALALLVTVACADAPEGVPSVQRSYCRELERLADVAPDVLEGIRLDVDHVVDTYALDPTTPPAMAASSCGAMGARASEFAGRVIALETIAGLADGVVPAPSANALRELTWADCGDLGPTELKARYSKVEGAFTTVRDALTTAAQKCPAR